MVTNSRRKQEFISVGCVPSAAVAICWEGVSAHGGVCLPQEGVCLLQGSVCLQGGVCQPGGCLPARGRGVCPGGCLPATGDVCLPVGCLPARGMSGRPPLDGILDTRLWKHYLSSTSFADGNKRSIMSNILVLFQTNW